MSFADSLSLHGGLANGSTDFTNAPDVLGTNSLLEPSRQTGISIERSPALEFVDSSTHLRSSKGKKLIVTGHHQRVNGTSGNDILDARRGRGNNVLNSGKGNDKLFAKWKDVLSGGAGNDVLDASKGRGRNVLKGDAGNDILFAGRSDKLFGGVGNDALWAKDGSSALTGGTGADKFWASSGSNIRITDFQVGTDLVGVIDASGVGQFEDLLLTQQKANTIVTFQGKTVTTLIGVSAQTLDQNNFTFVQSEGEAMEITFNRDLNGNGIIGPRPTFDTVVDFAKFLFGNLGLNPTNAASALWNSEYNLDARKLADLLWDEGSSPTEIGQAMKHVGISLEDIADGVKRGITKSDGTGLNDTDVAIALWNSGYSLDARKLADLLWDQGANPIEIGQAMKYLNLSLDTIADSVRWGVTKADGTNLAYHQVAEALWNSGYSGADGLDSRKLADLLWDNNASQEQIGQAFNYLGLSLEILTDAVKWGITQTDGTNLNYIDAAIAVWNSGYGLDTRKLADLLWDGGASQQQIGQIFEYFNWDLETIADAIDDGITNSDGTKLNYIDTALALWDSGYSLDTRVLAGLLWNEGASQGDIGQAIKYLGYDLATIADAMVDGPIDFNYTDTALALWDSGYSLDTRVLAGLLWNEGASQGNIGQAIKYLGYDLATIADAMVDGPIDFNYIDTALALWNSGYSLDTRVLAGLLWNEGASQGNIGQAIRNLGYDLATIADAMVDGPIDFNYIDTALALWNSGYSLDTRVLAGLLWNEGASQGNIGQAIRNLGYDLATIADAMDDGPIDFNYIDTALALWNSGHSLDTRVLAGLLWNEGASQGNIGQAIKYLGYDLATIADAMVDGPIDFNYIDTALALWNSGHSLDTRVLAGLLWNEGASQGNIGQAIRNLGYDLATIADAMVDGPTDFNYIDTALALWNSGHSITGGQLAALLWNEGASQGNMGQAMRALGFTNENIGYAVKNAPGIGFNYSDVARAVWDSGNAVSDFTIADIVKSLGGGYGDIVGALKEIGATDFRANFLAARASFISVVNKLFDKVEEVADKVEDVVSDIENSIPDNKVIDIVLLPYTLPAAVVVNTVEAVKQGDIEVIVDGLKKIPVLGTAVGVIDGVIKAAQGDEKGILEESINSALAFYGATNVITPAMVEFAVDVFWELKDSDYQGAISESLENLGMQKTVADLFVTVAWSMAADNNWESAINAALSKVGFNNANSFVDIAWDIIDQNYKEALKTGLELIGFTNLGINQAKADAFLNLTVAIRDGKPNQAADILIALSGNNQLVIQSSWVRDLKDGNLANDRQALQLGLSNLGFRDATQWVNTVWAVKEGKYLDALSTVMTLGRFTDGQTWVKIIDNLQKENYEEALSTAFKLADFPDGESLADAVLAVKEGDYITAFYESLNLVEGGQDLADAFKYLVKFDLQEFVTSMVSAAPLLLRVLV
ncbi:hypothetical protein H6G00_22380 [Leptolyngbya sp. FACHB-541]|uniref:hypothetical protein n=1 Tax=Leptolyngbya sp. FACHB-541 TaxID=2692810 RepID=UPI0016839E46|nr:hypothetical protein [Leptolyngbya sp. FACHB-541]MBD1999325.1 hypothetical protein [Leptolyngbya sp. FACHB-541]